MAEEDWTLNEYRLYRKDSLLRLSDETSFHCELDPVGDRRQSEIREREGSRGVHEAVLADAYRAAADILAENCRRPLKWRHLVFPILFLYHHYLEMVLKRLLKNIEFSCGRLEQAPRETHDLVQLWTFIRPKMEPQLRSLGGLAVYEGEIIARLLKEMERLTQRGAGVRYTHDRKEREYALPQEDGGDDVLWLDILVVQHTISRLGKQLEWLASIFYESPFE